MSEPAPPTLREIVDNFTIWRDHLLKWWTEHLPDERDLAIARQEISRPEVMAEIEKLNAVAPSSGPRTPSEAAIEAAARLRWERTESDSSPTKQWPEAPAWLQKAFRETATLELRAAYAIDAVGAASSDDRALRLDDETIVTLCKIGAPKNGQYDLVGMRAAILSILAGAAPK